MAVKGILSAVAHAVVHDNARAEEFAARAMTVDPDDPMLLYNVACTYARLEKANEALDALERAVEKGWGDKEWLEHDSDMDALREIPRFKSITQAM